MLLRFLNRYRVKRLKAHPIGVRFFFACCLGKFLPWAVENAKLFRLRTYMFHAAPSLSGNKTLRAEIDFYSLRYRCYPAQ